MSLRLRSEGSAVLVTTIRHILGSCSPQSSYLGPSSCFLCPGLKAFGEIPRLYKLLSYVCSAVLQRMGPCPRSDGRWRSYSPRQEFQDRWSPIRGKSTLIYLLIRQVKILMLFLIDILSTRRRQWHPTPVLLPGKSHGRRSLVGCSPWGR